MGAISRKALKGSRDWVGAMHEAMIDEIIGVEGKRMRYCAASWTQSQVTVFLCCWAVFLSLP